MAEAQAATCLTVASDETISGKGWGQLKKRALESLKELGTPVEDEANSIEIRKISEIPHDELPDLIKGISPEDMEGLSLVKFTAMLIPHEEEANGD